MGIGCEWNLTGVTLIDVRLFLYSFFFQGFFQLCVNEKRERVGERKGEREISERENLAGVG